MKSEKVFTQTVKEYAEKKGVSIAYNCKLFGNTRQAYYTSIKASQRRLEQEKEIISFVTEVYNIDLPFIKKN